MLKLEMLAADCLLLLRVTLTSAGSAEPSRRGEPTVRFVARFTAARGTWGTNDEIYLVEIHSAKHEELFYGKLVDRRLNLNAPLPQRILTSKSAVAMKIARDPEWMCPSRACQFVLPPGHQIALIHTKLTFQSPETGSIEANEILPRYRTEGNRLF